MLAVHISFDYPASLTPDPNSATSTSIPESYLYKYSDTQTWLLAISVNKLNQPSIDSDSNYQARKNDPTRYQESTVTEGDHAFYVMKDLDASGFAEVAFILNGNTSTDISLAGYDQAGNVNLENTFNMVLSSFQWEQ
jgi:hypothetical protein